MLMKCENVRQLLAEYRSDILSPRKNREIEEHIAACSDCARELNEFDAVMALVESNVPDYTPPQGLWNGVYNKITSPEQPVPVFGKIQQWLRIPIHAAGVGAAALAIVVGLFFSPVHQSPGSDLRMTTADNRYIQAHAYSVSQSPLADRAGYVSLITFSQESEDEQTH
ncbi:MAG: zf-HC2 domain-containing protein [Armatimonadota bacterium]|nr:zf-HC2 domain-containing protein [bacterium]